MTTGTATVPITGPGTVAALRAAIKEETQGAFAGFAGQDGHDTYGELEFTPADGSGRGVVGFNVQHGSILDGSGFNCAQTRMVNCRVRMVADGDRLRTYRDPPVKTAAGDGLRVAAELLTSDRS